MKSGQIPLKAKIAYVLEKDGAKHIKDISDLFPGIPESTIRGRLNENVGSLFERLGNGVYLFKGAKGTVGLIEGDARNLKGVIADNSVDLLISDHPWEDEKSHKGGTRNFANDYNCFKYDTKKDEKGNIVGSDDFKEKFRVLKEGGFLIEMLPEKNANNKRYLREIEDAAEAEGLEYFAEVPISGGNSNIGRKAKNISVVRFFTKGKARKLKIYSELLAQKSKEGEFKHFDYKTHASDFFKTYYESLSVGKMMETFDKNVNDKSFGVFKKLKTADDEIKLRGAFEEFSNFLRASNSFKSGTKKLLPEFFKADSNSNLRYQSQKPINVLRDIILQVSNEGELVLEQYARSFVCAEAVIELGNNGFGRRNYLGIEIDKDIVDDARKYLEEKYGDLKLLTKESFMNDISYDSHTSNTLTENESRSVIHNSIDPEITKLSELISKLNSEFAAILKISPLDNINLLMRDDINENNKKLGELDTFNVKGGITAKHFKEGFRVSIVVNKSEKEKLNLSIIAKDNDTFSLLKDGELFKTSKPGARLDDLLVGICNTFVRI